MVFELFKISSTEKYSYRLINNGQVILRGETYSSKRTAEMSIYSVQNNTRSLNNFVTKKAKDGQYYFVVKAKNGEIVGMSGFYQSMNNLINDMDSIVKNDNSPIVDCT